jgi:tetratricopeptide (TPR) repeat protein
MERSRAVPFGEAPRGAGADGAVLFCCLVLAIAAALAYGRTFSAPFLFDDEPTILRNETIREWRTALSPPGDTTASGRPLVNLSLAFNYAIGGTDVWSYHVFNLAVHILCGLTLFGIVRRLLPPGSWPAAFCAALLWTLHPLDTEAVTYIVQRAESMMSLFYLQAIYWFVRSKPSAPTALGAGPAESGHGAKACAVASVLCCALGMATKEVMVSAPVVIFLIDRLCFAGSPAEAWRLRRPYYCGLAATWLLLAWLVWTAGSRGGTSGFDVGVSAWRYWATQPLAIVRYLRLAVWPHPQVFDYGPQWLWTPGRPPSAKALFLGLLLPGAAIAALAAVAAVGVWRNRWTGLFGFFFFAILAPTSVIPGNRQTAAEHRMYLALAPVAVAVALVATRRLGRAAVPTCLLLAAALGLATIHRNRDYATEVGIWTDTVDKVPDNYFARNNLGMALEKVPGRLPDAIAQLREALRLDPSMAVVHFNLGEVLSRVPGRLDEAASEFREAIRLQPNLVPARVDLGDACLRQPGHLDEAVAQFKEAVRLNPDSAAARVGLGNSLARLPGRLDDAVSEYQAALRLNPSLAEAHFNLAVALLQLGRVDEARTHLEAGLVTRPDDAAALRLLEEIRAH